jgi:cytochrome c biogenesis protein CcdA
MFIVGTGLLEVKDYFWYGQGLSLNAPVLAVRQVKALTKSKPGWMAAVALGLFVAVVSTPAIGACYIALMTLLRNHFDTWGVELLALYSSVFILPMLVMVSMAAGSVRLSSLLRWREEHKAGMRLLSGLLLIALGWLLLLVTNGVINLG